MAKNIKVRVNTGNEESNKTFDIAQGNGKTANPTRIKAVKGARYHLEDPAAKNVGPENIRSKRIGKDLHVMLDGSNEADFIIEGYYDEAMLTENNRGLYGRAEDGKMYEYIPEDPTLEGMPINLADGGRPVSQVLGGVPIGEAFELSGLVLVAAGGGFSALTAGAAAVGAAALAGGGGGGGGGGPATTPTDPAATALASIKAAAEGNTATSGNLAATVFTAAGITGVDTDNLAAIQSALDSAAVNGAAADTKAEVQAIVDAYNAIKANADTVSTTNATQAQYAAVGVTGIDNAAKTNLLGDVVDSKAFADVDTLPELQALATAAATVITGAAAGTQPTKAQLEALGITGVTDANLSAIQAAIAATPDDGTGVDTLSELQAVANAGANNAANAAAALSAIAAAAQANNATDANVTTSVFTTAGVTGVDSTNVAAIQSALNSAAVVGTSADTLPEVQAIVDAYNAVKANADGTANNNATNPTQAQYAAIGVTGVNSDVKASLLGDVVDSKPFTGVDTVPELQALADAAAAVMTAAAGTAGGTGPTRAQLEALGITGVTDANLAEVQATIARTADDGIGVDTLAELQAVVTIGADAAAAAAAAAVAAALAAITAAAQANDASNTNVAASVFATAGVTGVDSTNLAAIQSALNSAAVNGSATDTLVEIQNIVNAYNAIRENADGTASNFANNPTQAQYALIGVTGVNSAEKESLLGDVVDSKPFSAVDSVAEVQALADAAAAVIASTTGGTAPTQAQLTALGITGVTPANLTAVQAAIAANGSGAAGVDTLTELQTVVTNAAAAAAALDAIKTAAENNSAGTTPSVADFATAGITGVDANNFAAINSALNSSAVNGAAADTKPEVQAIVDAYNAIKANADGTANNNATNPTQAQYTAIGVTGVSTTEQTSLLGDVIDAKPFTGVDTVAEVQALADAAAAVITGATGGTAPTQAQLNALGITGVTTANLAAVQAAIAANGNGAAGVDTLTELQTVVTNAANAAAAAAALSAIAAAAQANDATDANVATTVFATAGVTGVDSTNVAAIQSALNSAAVLGTSADTLGEVQAIVDAYNAIKANADGTAANYGTNPTQAQYTAIGVTGVDSAVKTSLLGDAIDGKAFGDVDTVPEVQALANAAAAVIAGATGGTAPTQAQLNALGITGVTPANLAAVQAAIAATGNGGTGVDTLGELQTVVTNAVNAAAAITAALDAIKAAAEGNTATSGNLAASVFATAGVTGVDANNLAAIQSALDSAAVNGLAADTTAEVQAIVDSYNAIKANADGTAANYATNPTQAQYAAIGVTGVNSATKESLLGDVVDAKPFTAVDTVGELQTLADAAAAVMTGASAGTAPTKAQLEALGITGVTDANLSAIQAAIAATADDGTGVDTLSELQAVANTGATNAANAAAIAAALSTIAAAAQANNATDTNVPYTLFATAGVTGVDANNIAAIQSALNDADVQSGQADTAAKVQAVVDAYNAIKANADTASTANATQAQYAAIGINGIDNAAKTSLLGDVVDTKAFADVDTVGELQTLADAAAAVMTGATAGTAPTKEQLQALGITGVTDANLSAIQAAIAATADDGSGVDTLSELQAVANTGATNAANAAAAAALSTIAAAAQANDASNTNVPASVFATAGVTGVDANNIAAIQSALNDTDVQSGQADTAAKVQAVVDAYNAIKANADAAGATNATQAQYAAIGINGIDNAVKTSLLGDVVDTKAFADVDTVGELQDLATAAAAVISGATAGGTVPTKAQLEALGITGVTTGNLAAVLAAIAATPDDGTGVDTLTKLQTLVSSINDAPTGTSSTITVAEDGSKTFAAADFGFADASDSPANTLQAVIITTLPTAGTLKLSGTDVTVGQSIAVANLGNLVFAPAANANGNAYTTLGFKVQDNGGTANGGADTSTTANTLTFNVTAVNDPATFSGDISKATLETDVAQTITGQLNVADIDSATTVTAQTNVAGSAGLGKFTINSTGAWSYVMDSAQNQLKPADVITDSLTVSTADGTTQTISVVITGTNDAPIVANALADTTATATVAITNYVVPANAFSDVDSTTLTYTATLADGSALSTVGLSFDATTRTVSGAPSAGTAGSTLSVKVTASDGSLSAFDTFDIVVASPDNIAPTLLSSTPADNGTVAYANVANNLTLNFSEAVQKGTGVIELYNASNTLVESFDVATSTKVTGWNGLTLTIDPTANLAAGTGYYVKVATTAIKDLANNAYAGITDATTLNFTVSAGAGSEIDLGTSGKLIAPVQVEGKWYYFWDVSGDRIAASADTKTHDQLDAIFNQDINGNVNPNGVTADTNDVYRYATINGVQLALPTANGNIPYVVSNSGTSTSTYGTTNNSSFDEMLAIWDIASGAQIGIRVAGQPTGWMGGTYWSATLTSASNHAYLGTDGQAQTAGDVNACYTAIQVVAANTAPVLDAAQSPTLTTVSASAGAPSGAVGNLVSSLVTGISDADSGASKGIAITGVHTVGTVYYSLNGGTTWTAASGLSDTNALLLASDTDTRVYFMPNGASGTITDAITFRAWDMTANITEGVYTDTTPRGGKAQFSLASDTVSVVSTDPGFAQVQAAAMGLQLQGSSQTANSLTLSEFHTVAYTVPTGVSYELHSSNGTVIKTGDWSSQSGQNYSLSFQTSGWASGEQFYGTLTYSGVSYRWNQGVQFNGASAPTTTTYGSPLVLDLNGDGVQTLAMSEGVSFDVLNTGSKQTVGWVDKHDGLLAIDLNGDGQINSGAELFGDHTQLANGALAKDGWAALTAMDTNGDGKVDAQDANFDKLRVWVDANSDGVTDAGELHTLAEAKVASINLHADTTQTLQNGNWLQGFSSFTSTDGVSHEMVDAWLQMAATGVKTLNNGESLDLSTVSNLSLVTGVNMSADTAANTVKLTLADVLSVATDASIANGVHKLTLTGDANDTVELDLSQWANTGTTVTEGDHTYAVYNASSAAAAQLLIDQHMVLANHG